MKRLGNIKKKYFVIFLAMGIVLVFLSDFAMQKKQEEVIAPRENVCESENTEEKLKKIIESLDGVSDVSVFISYDNKGQRSIASHGEESSTKDGNKSVVTRKNQAVTQRDSSGESPFVTEELMPRIRGIIIAARGVGDETKNAIITQAVSSALGVPLHRVRVLSKD